MLLVILCPVKFHRPPSLFIVFVWITHKGLFPVDLMYKLMPEAHKVRHNLASIPASDNFYSLVFPVSPCPSCCPCVLVGDNPDSKVKLNLDRFGDGW